MLTDHALRSLIHGLLKQVRYTFEMVVKSVAADSDLICNTFDTDLMQRALVEQTDQC